MREAVDRRRFFGRIGAAIVGAPVLAAQPDLAPITAAIREAAACAARLDALAVALRIETLLADHGTRAEPPA